MLGGLGGGVADVRLAANRVMSALVVLSLLRYESGFPNVLSAKAGIYPAFPGFRVKHGMTKSSLLEWRVAE